MARAFRSLWLSGESLLARILDVVAPPDPVVRSLELMSPSQFFLKAEKSDPAEEIEGVFSAFSYKDPLVKSCVLEVKSYGNSKLARLLGEALYEAMLPELSELETFNNFSRPLLVLVPLTKKSLRKRGWNQSELIARAIASADQGATLEIRTDILWKWKETGDQVGKSRTERFENLKGCFSVRNPDLVRGRNVIVLDDIVTTGATLKEARRALLANGAKKVFLVAVCH